MIEAVVFAVGTKSTASAPNLMEGWFDGWLSATNSRAHSFRRYVASGGRGKGGRKGDTHVGVQMGFNLIPANAV